MDCGGQSSGHSQGRRTEHYGNTGSLGRSAPFFEPRARFSLPVSMTCSTKTANNPPATGGRLCALRPHGMARHGLRRGALPKRKASAPMELKDAPARGARRGPAQAIAVNLGDFCQSRLPARARQRKTADDVARPRRGPRAHAAGRTGSVPGEAWVNPDARRSDNACSQNAPGFRRDDDE